MLLLVLRLSPYLLVLVLIMLCAGLGKTLQALAVYVHLRRFGGDPFEGKPVLIVCPLSVISSWLRHCVGFLGAVDLLQQQQEKTAAAESQQGVALRLVLFVGDAANRAEIQRRVYDLQHKRQQQARHFSSHLTPSLRRFFLCLSALCSYESLSPCLPSRPPAISPRCFGAGASVHRLKQPRRHLRRLIFS